MKRLLALGAAILVILGCTACRTEKTGTTTATTTTTTSATVVEDDDIEIEIEATEPPTSTTVVESAVSTTAATVPTSTGTTQSTTVTTTVKTTAKTTTTTRVTTTAATAHAHVAGEWTVEQPATCSKNGEQVRACTLCGAVTERQAITKLPHTFDGQNICTVCLTVDVADTAIAELGNPFKGYYASGAAANCAWDIKVWNGKVYRGGGDYDKNTGNTSIWAYDIAASQWTATGTLSEEQVSRFAVIDGALMAPGIDPTDSWDYGNYYRLDGTEWTKFRTIPGGIHAFDMAKFDGKLFFGLGVDVTSSPVAYTTDNKEFTFVPLYKDGQPYDMTGITVIRVYEYFTCGGNLYAVLTRTTATGTRCEIFRYEDDKMVYVTKASSLVSGARISYNMMNAKCEYNGAAYLATHYLYRTADGATFEKVALPGGENVSDLLIDGDSMLILSYIAKAGGGYTTVIYRMTGSDIAEVTRLDYAVPAHAFDKYGGYYYLAMGDKRLSHEKNGMLLRVQA